MTQTEKNAGVNPPNTSTRRPPPPGGSRPSYPPCRRCGRLLDFVPSDVLYRICGPCQRVEDMMAYTMG